MTFIGKDGYPVETIKGRPFTNLIRILVHTSIKQTLSHPICGRCGHYRDAGCGSDYIPSTDARVIKSRE